MKTIQGTIVRLKIHFIPVIPCRGYQWPVGPPTRSGIGDSLRVKPAELQSKFAAPYIAVPCALSNSFPSTVHSAFPIFTSGHSPQLAVLVQIYYSCPCLPAQQNDANLTKHPPK